MANQKKPATPPKPAEPKPTENARYSRAASKGGEPKAAKAEAPEESKAPEKAKAKAPEKAEEPKDKAARQLALPEAPETPAPPAVTEVKAEEKPAEKAGKKGREPAAAPDPAEALERFRAEAAALPGEPEPCNNVDLDAVRANVAEALAALEPHLDAAAAALPKVNPAALRDLPALVHALELAIVQANPPEASKGEIQARLRKVRPGRALALRQLEILSDEQVGLIPAAKVQKIRQGTGPIDTARDAVAIRALFQEYYLSTYNKHPLSQTFLDELAQDGEWLLAQMRPKNAPRSEEDELAPAMRARDQLWALLQKRYDDAYLVAVEVWGRRAAEGHVPPLLSRRAAPTTPAPPQG